MAQHFNQKYGVLANKSQAAGAMIRTERPSTKPLNGGHISARSQTDHLKVSYVEGDWCRPVQLRAGVDDNSATSHCGASGAIFL
jgi:hypothetical protein